MRKKTKRSAFKQLFRKSSLTGLILLLLLTLYELAGNFQPTQTLQLPGSNEPAALYSNQTQDDLTRLFQQTIGQANHSITFAVYSLMDNHIIQALKDKTEASLPVHIVCEAKESPGITRKLPKATIVRRFGDGLMHHKILVVDEKHLLLGSANMTHSSLNTHGNLVIGLNNPSLGKLLTKHIQAMEEEGKGSTPLRCETTTGNQQMELWILPNEAQAVERIKILFRSAKKTIQIAMFTFTRTDFAKELIAAAKRGVKIEAVLDHYSGKGASAPIVRMLQQAALPVHLSTGQGLLHYKFAYIDGETLIHGSANWTNRAFKDNDDYFIVLHPLTPDQKNKMDQLYRAILKQSEKVKNSDNSCSALQYIALSTIVL